MNYILHQVHLKKFFTFRKKNTKSRLIHMIILNIIFLMIQEEHVNYNLNMIHNKITYQHYIHQISSSQALHT